MLLRFFPSSFFFVSSFPRFESLRSALLRGSASRFSWRNVPLDRLSRRCCSCGLYAKPSANAMPVNLYLASSEEILAYNFCMLTVSCSASAAEGFVDHEGALGEVTLSPTVSLPPLCYLNPACFLLRGGKICCALALGSSSNSRIRPSRRSPWLRGISPQAVFRRGLATGILNSRIPKSMKLNLLSKKLSP